MFCYVCGNCMEIIYVFGVVYCDNWKVFVLVFYSKCKIGVIVGILYIVMLYDSI